eukprot:scaffold41186_cov63-Phaeocystis_antarctica.AAC.1
MEQARCSGSPTSICGVSTAAAVGRSSSRRRRSAALGAPIAAKCRKRPPAPGVGPPHPAPPRPPPGLRAERWLRRRQTDARAADPRAASWATADVLQRALPRILRRVRASRPDATAAVAHPCCRLGLPRCAATPRLGKRAPLRELRDLAKGAQPRTARCEQQPSAWIGCAASRRRGRSSRERGSTRRTERW